MNIKYQNMTKAELIKALMALERKLRAPTQNSVAPAHDHLLHELHVHQVELESQNQELRDAHQLLEESRNRYADLYDLAPIGYLTLDGTGLITEVNLSGASMMGVERSRLTGLPLGILVARDDKHILREHLRRCQSAGPTQSELRLALQNGDIIWVELHSVSIAQGAEHAPRYFTAMTDITERKQIENHLRHLNAHDALTGLYNRAHFEEELARHQSGRQFPISVVMADLDNLKLVNDRHGHAQGDEFLQRAAQVFRGVFRSEDVVARIGGDEFAAILPSTDGADANMIVQRIRTDLAALDTAGRAPCLSLSLGVATAIKGEPILQALNQADERMYREKALKSLRHGGRETGAVSVAGPA